MMENMNEKELFEKLKQHLLEMFRTGDSDFNWGVYRIMNQKNEEINYFITKKLKEIIDNELNGLSTIEEKELEKEIKELKESSKKYCFDLEENEKYKKLMKRKKEKKSFEEKQEEIYNRLIEFFSRYYVDGDFISKFFYNDETYLIPYDGSETAFHWATKDMYYVKSSEQFKRISFNLRNHNLIFKLNSTEEEKGNNKEKTFYFDFDALEKKDDGIYLCLKKIKEDEELKSLETNKIKRQEKLNEKIIDNIIEKLNEEDILKKKLNENDKYVMNNMIGEKIQVENLEKNKNIGKKDRETLLKNLKRFQRKYKEDFFIHRNLKEFLTMQMKIYINREILDVDSFLNTDATINENSKIVAVVFKRICESIISKLADLEDLKKKIWEKKKFVLDTQYCITLDNICEKHYPKILSNEKQMEEWKNLFSFDMDEKVKEQKTKLDGLNKSPEQIKTQILKENPTLVIDTKFYDEDFKYELIGEIDNLDENINGILIKSDNFHALNLLQEKYKEKIKCCYIDPPYNTGNDGFLYKDTFKSSSWLSFIYDRIFAVKYLLEKKGNIFISIANSAKYYFESYKLNLITSTIYPKRFGELIWKRRSGSGSNTIFDITEHHEYVLVYGFENSKLFKNLLSPEKLKEYIEKDSIGVYRWNNVIINQYTKFSRPNLFYYVIFNKVKNKLYFEERNLSENEIKIYPSDKGNSVFFCDKNSMEQIYKRGILKVDEKKSKYYIKIKKYLYDFDGNVDGNVLKSILHENKIPLEVKGTSQGTSELKHLFHICPFNNPKPISLIRLIQQVSLSKTEFVIDFFAGSGTTGHAVLKLNKEDEGKRKFILVEMGEYFDTVIKPRILKVIYSDNWKDGKPQDNNGTKKQIIKYQSLEQYEDALENIEFKQKLLEINDFEKLKKEGEYENYLNAILRYGIDETKTKNFLGVDTEKEFLDLKLKILDKKGESNYEKVDLIETFIYLLGMHVKSIKTHLKMNKKYYVIIGKIEDELSIAIWRKPPINKIEKEEDKKIIKEFLQNEMYEKIYVNSDCLIEDYLNIYDEMRNNLQGDN